MIILFSDPYDISSRKIIEWLQTFKAPIIVVNDKENHYIDLIALDNKNLKININDSVFAIKDITAVYYRRAGKISKLHALLKKTSRGQLNSNKKSFISYLAYNEKAKGEILSTHWGHKMAKNGGRRAKRILLKRPETLDFAGKSKTQQKFICWVKLLL